MKEKPSKTKNGSRTRGVVVGAIAFCCLTWLYFAYKNNNPFNPFPNDEVVSLAFSPDGKMLAIGYSNIKVVVVDVKTGHIVWEPTSGLPEETDQESDVAFSPNGKLLACSYGGSFVNTIHIWDVKRKVIKFKLLETGGHIAFSSDSKTLFDGGAEYKKEDWFVATKMWDMQTGKSKRVFGTNVKGSIVQMALSQNNRVLVAANDSQDTKAEEGMNITTDAITFCARDVKSGKILWQLKEDPLFSTDIALAPKSSLMANIGTNTINIRSIKTGKLANHIAGYASCIAFSPDGKTLSVGLAVKGEIDVWDTSTWSLMKTLHEHIDGYVQPVNVIVYSLDGKHMASGGADHTVKVWDAYSNTLIYSLGQSYEQRRNPFS